MGAFSEITKPKCSKIAERPTGREGGERTLPKVRETKNESPKLNLMAGTPGPPHGVKFGETVPKGGVSKDQITKIH